MTPGGGPLVRAAILARAYRDYADRVAFESRLVGAGITAAELDALVSFALEMLEREGRVWFLYTQVQGTEQLIDSADGRAALFYCKGYAGAVYARNDYGYHGTTPGKGTAYWRTTFPDGREPQVYQRQGARTVSWRTVRTMFPGASAIAAVPAQSRQRWVRTLGTPEERAWRSRLLIPARAPDPLVQLRLCVALTGWLIGWATVGRARRVGLRRARARSTTPALE